MSRGRIARSAASRLRRRLAPGERAAARRRSPERGRSARGSRVSEPPTSARSRPGRPRNAGRLERRRHARAALQDRREGRDVRIEPRLEPDLAREVAVGEAHGDGSPDAQIDRARRLAGHRLDDRHRERERVPPGEGPVHARERRAQPGREPDRRRRHPRRGYVKSKARGRRSARGVLRRRRQEARFPGDGAAGRLLGPRDENAAPRRGGHRIAGVHAGVSKSSPAWTRLFLRRTRSTRKPRGACRRHGTRPTRPSRMRRWRPDRAASRSRSPSRPGFVHVRPLSSEATAQTPTSDSLPVQARA